MARHIGRHFYDQEPVKTDNNASLYVSVYLVILAFFIVLASHAKIENDKAKNVITNVKQVFAGESDELVFSTEAQNKGNDVGNLEALEIIAESYKNQKYLTLKKKVGVLQITIPQASVFEGTTSVINQDVMKFFQDIAIQMKAIKSGTRVDLETRIPAPKIEQFSDAENSIELARAGVLYRKLSALGISEDRIFTGIDIGKKNDRIVFRFYDRTLDKEKIVPKKGENSMIPVEAN